MLAKRIIPCLDIKDGKVVKGVNFLGLQSVGDPVEMGKQYAAEGADELVFLDISATLEGRKTFAELVGRIADEINIPFTVGGGISSVEDAGRLLYAGADKVTVNSAAVRRPELIDEIASKYGSQFIVVAIDAKQVPTEDSNGMRNRGSNLLHDSSTAETSTSSAQNRGKDYRSGSANDPDLGGAHGCGGEIGGGLTKESPGANFSSAQNRGQDSTHNGAPRTCSPIAILKTNTKWLATTHGGKKLTDKELFSWAKEAADRGAGEILFTSMDHDGTKNGYPCDVYAALAEMLPIPVIASGGAGSVQDIADVLTLGHADAALAASIFHYGEIPIPRLKTELRAMGIPVRL